MLPNTSLSLAVGPQSGLFSAWLGRDTSLGDAISRDMIPARQRYSRHQEGQDIQFLVEILTPSLRHLGRSLGFTCNLRRILMGLGYQLLFKPLRLQSLAMVCPMLRIDMMRCRSLTYWLGLRLLLLVLLASCAELRQRTAHSNIR